MDIMTAANYAPGTGILAEQLPAFARITLDTAATFGASVAAGGTASVGAKVSAEHGEAFGAGLWLARSPMTAVATSPICAALRSQSAQEEGTAIFGGGMVSVQTGSPAVIADDKPNFRTGAPPRDRQPV